MRTLVVMGTGTDVGKTYVSKSILDLLKRHVVGSIVGLKPVESGVTAIADTDAAVLAAHSRPIISAEHAFALRAPISPHLAARLEQVQLSVAAVTAWVNRTAVRATNATLATAFEPSTWLLVAPDRLGVLHDLTATLGALERLARKPDIVLLNSPSQPDASTGTNRAEIERLGIAEVAAVLGRNEGFTVPDQERLLKCLGII
jgi:dethiobiotin synthetase